ncbi:MAG: sugar phosphate isomerase/epimerase [Sphingobacteriaceae bacterium]|nr:MAG: sugar phosphate isomerase/epimerase [Sphingobacteriaceae bacterium]
MTTRRKFIAQTTLAAAGTLLLSEQIFAKANYKTGIQLFSMRDQIGNDIKSLIAKLAKAGYQEMETFGYDPNKGYFGLKPAEFKQTLTANGMTTSSGHYGIDSYLGTGNDEVLKVYIDVAKTCGQQYLTIPSVSGELIKTVDDCKKLAEKMNMAAELCKKSGLKLAYHNHNFEFRQIDNTTPYDVLLKETDKKLVSFEMDIYWVVRAGQDPVKMIEQHPGRFHMWHIKDMDKNKTELNTEIGNGSIDFKKIFAQAKKSGLEHIFMEQENFTDIDPYKSITQSASYIKTQLL